MNPITHVALLVTLLAAGWDARTGRIPNWLTLPLVPVALLLHGVTGGSSAAIWGLAGLLACLIVPGVLYRASRGRGIGGGDVKLFAALGALLGPVRGIELEFGAFVVLAVIALVRLAYAGRLFAVLRNAVMLLLGPLLPASWRHSPAPEAMTEMRMGPAIAIACLSTLYVADLVEPWLA
ncbi:MAG TPA: A24 family peptidase [Polyangiaceae bacterium]|nr:A24 family peptidase [Polyangiaceae bacterium]